MDVIEAKTLLEDQSYNYDVPRLSHMEVLNLFDAVAKRCGTELSLYANHQMIYIGNFEQLTEAMFESEFKLILERANCGYDDESEDWFMYT